MSNLIEHCDWSWFPWNEKGKEYNTGVIFCHPLLGKRCIKTQRENQKREKEYIKFGGVGDEKKLEEVEGVESKSGIIGTDISIKQLILSRPEVSLETPSSNCF